MNHCLPKTLFQSTSMRLIPTFIVHVGKEKDLLWQYFCNNNICSKCDENKQKIKLALDFAEKAVKIYFVNFGIHPDAEEKISKSEFIYNCDCYLTILNTSLRKFI